MSFSGARNESLRLCLPRLAAGRQCNESLWLHQCVSGMCLAFTGAAPAHSAYTKFGANAVVVWYRSAPGTQADDRRSLGAILAGGS